MTIEEQAREFYRRRALPEARVEFLNSGRVSDVIVTVNGRTIAQRTVIRTARRGESVTYFLPEDV